MGVSTVEHGSQPHLDGFLTNFNLLEERNHRVYDESTIQGMELILAGRDGETATVRTLLYRILDQLPGRTGWGHSALLREAEIWG